MTLPSLYMACCSASNLSDVSFTDGSFLPFMVMLNKRSKIIQNAYNLCGIAAIRDILRFLGRLCFMSFHLINLTHLSLTLSSALFLQAVAASWDCADR